MRKLFLAIGIFFALTASAAADYCVSTAGNDSNTGICTCSGTTCSDSQAWRTITKVNTHTPSAGTTIRFHDDQSWSDAQLLIKASGTSGNPITYTRYGNGTLRPLLTGTNATNITSTNKSYYTIDGLRIINQSTNGAGSGVNVLGSTAGVRIVNSYIQMSATLPQIPVRVEDSPNFYVGNNDILGGRYGVYFLSNTLGVGFPGVIENNRISNQTGNTLSSAEWDGLKCGGRAYFDGLIVRGNTISGASEDGMDFLFCGGLLIERNIVKDSGILYTNGNPSGIKIRNSAGTVVRYNLIYNIAAPDVDAWPNDGIALTDADGGRCILDATNNLSWNSRGTANQFYGNIMYGCETYGIYGDDAISNLHNNTIISGAHGTRYVNQSFVNMKNNIISGPTADVSGTLGAIVNAQNNLLVKKSLTTTLNGFGNGAQFNNNGGNLFLLNPLFVSEAGNNYHLQATSPAVNAGTVTIALADFDGNAIPAGSAPDIGAYEYASLPHEEQQPNCDTVPEECADEGECVGAAHCWEDRGEGAGEMCYEFCANPDCGSIASDCSNEADCEAASWCWEDRGSGNACYETCDLDDDNGQPDDGSGSSANFEGSITFHGLPNFSGSTITNSVAEDVDVPSTINANFVFGSGDDFVFGDGTQWVFGN